MCKLVKVDQDPLAQGPLRQRILIDLHKLAHSSRRSGNGAAVLLREPQPFRKT